MDEFLHTEELEDLRRESNLVEILKEITEQKPKNHTIKRMFEYAKIFFLNEEIRKLIINHGEISPKIFDDSIKVIEEFMKNNFSECKIVTVPIINDNNWPIIDFSEILN